ncbi:hypothetical protein BDW68DRAFT_191537 [Aspergillus falconensis]
MPTTSTWLSTANPKAGHIGKALLGAVLPSVSQPNSRISKITVSLPRKDSLSDLQRQFHKSLHLVNFVTQRNVEAATNSDAVLLAFPPDKIHEVLEDSGMREGLKDKIIISILARTPWEKVEHILTNGGPGSNPSPHQDYRIIRAMPTIGAGIYESATLLSSANLDTNKPAHRDALDFTAAIFSSLGRVFRIPNDYFDRATGMSAVSNALTTVAVQAIVKNAAAHGISEEHAIAIAAQCIRGTASVMLSGVHPDQLEHWLSAPGSITEQAIAGVKDGQLDKSLERVLSVAVCRARDHRS